MRVSVIPGPFWTVSKDPADTQRRSSARSVFVAGLMISIVYVIADRLMEDVLKIESEWGQLGELGLMSLTGSAILWLAVLRPLHGQIDVERDAARARQLETALGAAQQQFEARLHRAMEMATTEEIVYDAARKALSDGLGGATAELLLADSSDAHLKRAMTVRLDDVAGCGVLAPKDCPAIRRSQTMVFDSSDELDACPHLAHRAHGSCSAACVPVSVGGRSIGVLHASSSVDAIPTTQHVERLEAVANHAGSRLGMLRVMSATTLQAATDPLTGLLNRRSFENQVQLMIKRQRPFALAMGDLDRFKRLNDTHGHDAGDRALRLFARVLQASLRDDDIVCRYGGEEFVIAFPSKNAEEAARALGRMQVDLENQLGNGTVAAFTVSFGVAQSDQASTLEEICRIADTALFLAKRQGRNRVVVDGAAPDADQTITSDDTDLALLSQS